MKTTIASLLFIGCLFSCSKETQQKAQASDQQKWQLVKMSGSMISSETTGKDMSWQEYYLFNSDSTFIKSREQNNIVKEATGSYSYVAKDNEKYILLNFKTGTELIASCLGQQQEHLSVVSTEKLLGTWNICDGPGLEYQLVKQDIKD